MNRKLDMAIVDALGCEIIIDPNFGLGYQPDKKRPRFTNIPMFSTDGNEMLGLVAEMRKRGRKVEIIEGGGRYLARFYYTASAGANWCHVPRGGYA